MGTFRVIDTPRTICTRCSHGFITLTERDGMVVHCTALYDQAIRIKSPVLTCSKYEQIETHPQMARTAWLFHPETKRLKAGFVPPDEYAHEYLAKEDGECPESDGTTSTPAGTSSTRGIWATVRRVLRAAISSDEPGR